MSMMTQIEEKLPVPMTAGLTAVRSRRRRCDSSMAIGALIIGDEILSGKRQDKHLPHVIETLAARGLALDFAHYLGDDRERLTALLRDSFARGDLVFSFGGIGATPDDHTRQAAAAALGRAARAASGGRGRDRGALRCGGVSEPRADGGVPGGQPHHPESRQPRGRLRDPRPPLLSRLSADGVADDRLGAGRRGTRTCERDAAGRAPSSSTAPARASCCR